MSDRLPSDKFMRAILGEVFMVQPDGIYSDTGDGPAKIGERMAYVDKTELHALLSRVREMRTNPAYPDRNAVAYDCYRMFEDLAGRYVEECAMRDRYKRQSDGWRDKALQLAQEARCPCCVNGQTLAGEVCQECHGQDSSAVAYDTCRIHFKLLEEDCEKAIANLNRFARCTIGQPTPDDVEWARKWLADHGEPEFLTEPSARS